MMFDILILKILYFSVFSQIYLK